MRDNRGNTILQGVSKKRVGVLMAGPSCEREISIKSGKAVYNALQRIGIDCTPIELMNASDMDGYRQKIREFISSFHIDVAFIALHGEFGEDGTVQEILEEMGIPYTGSKPEASRIGMDKIRAKDIFRVTNIPVPIDVVLERAAFDKGCDSSKYFDKLGSQIVIKPYNRGSSIGLSIVDRESDFCQAVINAFRYSDKVIIEEYIDGREVTVGIIEDTPLPVIEIVPKRKFFDFTAKYEKGNTDYIVPAKIDESSYMLSQDIALAAHKGLGIRSFSRVDMILNGKGIPVVLEVNTIPGLTEMSLLPKAALAAGIGFEELCLKILESSLW